VVQPAEGVGNPTLPSGEKWTSARSTKGVQDMGICLLKGAYLNCTNSLSRERDTA
jgi:hypothetical protein